MKKLYFYSNVRYLIDKNYPSIYALIKSNPKLKQNTIQDYYNRKNDCESHPKFENVLELANIFNISLDDLVYKDLTKEKEE